MEQVAGWLDQSFLSEPWPPQVLMILIVAIVLDFAARYFLHRAEILAGKTKTVWDDALLRSAGRPLHLAIWVVALAMAVDILGQHIQIPGYAYLSNFRETGLVAASAWFLINLIHNATNNVIEASAESGEPVDRTTVDALSKMARLIVVVVTALFALHAVGFNINGLLAAGGIGGIAIGFAAKDLLANFFGGLTIYMDRPFSVGEWIRSPDKDIEGTVEYISWRHTRIRRFNKNPIYVPNALFTTIAVENPSRMSNRRIKETFGIRYADIDKMKAIVDDVRSMLQNHPEIDAQQTLIVNFDTFSASSLDFFIYTFTRTREWVRFHEVKQDVLLKVAAIVQKHGAEMAFPTRTLYIESEGAPPG